MFRPMDEKESLQQTIQAYRAAQTQLKMQLKAFFASMPYPESQVVKLVKSGMLNDQPAMQEAKQKLTAIENNASANTIEKTQKQTQIQTKKRKSKSAPRKTLQV